jgi:hypothetical protein
MSAGGRRRSRTRGGHAPHECLYLHLGVIREIRRQDDTEVTIT